jgi:hypothetical protein
MLVQAVVQVAVAVHQMVLAVLEQAVKETMVVLVKPMPTHIQMAVVVVVQVQ